MFVFRILNLQNINIGNHDTYSLVKNTYAAGKQTIQITQQQTKTINKNTTVKMAEYTINDTTWLNIPYLLFGIIRFFAFIITFFVALINWALSPDFISMLLNNDGVHTGYQMVRDFLNILFIFFLLFSAFATVFQVSKYHIKNTWVLIVVMALLVNFSWPIARVIIDVSNVTMSYMLDQSGGINSLNNDTGNSLMAKMGENSYFAGLLIGQNRGDITLDSKDYPVLFLGILAGFLFMVTVGAIALILVIRGIVLAILLVFASMGFVMAAFPSTRSYASQWWNSLMKYAFIGPILLFMLLLSVVVMESAGESGFISGAPTSEGPMGKVVTIMMQYSIALVLLWAGIITAGKLSDGASGMVVSKAKGAANWGGKKLKQGAFGGTKFVWSGTKFVGRSADNLTGGRVGGIVSGVKKRYGKIKSDFNDNYQAKKDAYAAKIAQAGSGKKIMGYGSDPNALKGLENKKVAKVKKKLKDDNVDTQTAMSKAKTATGAEQRALVEYLTSQKDFGKGDDKNYDSFINSLHKFPEELQKTLTDKLVKEGKAHMVYNKIARESNEQEAFNQVYKNMNAQTLAKNAKSLKIAVENPNSDIYRDFKEKLKRAGFERDFERYAVATDVYNNAMKIKGS